MNFSKLDRLSPWSHLGFLHSVFHTQCPVNSHQALLEIWAVCRSDFGHASSAVQCTSWL